MDGVGKTWCRFFLVSTVLCLTTVVVFCSDPVWQKGEIIPRVETRVDPEESYALYLPRNFDNQKSWPILYCFDARRRGTLPLEKLKNAADRFGFILASANNACSDGPVEPNLKAMDAMWLDTHARFNLEPGQAYATGLSGGARVASLMGLIYPGEVAGVIGVCAGLSAHLDARQKLPFLFYGLTGDKDYNYYELHKLGALLQRSGSKHRLQVFSGYHQWAPAEAMEQALAWMVLQTHIQKGGDPATLRSLWDMDLARADRLQAEGNHFAYGRLLKAIASDYKNTGLALDDLNQRLETLKKDGDYRWSSRAHQKIISREGHYFDKLDRLVKQIHQSDSRGELLVPGGVLFELKITALKRKAKKTGNTMEKLSAIRRLETAFVELGFYQARSYMNDGDNRRAQLCLAAASEIKPDNPFIWYNLARTQARVGQDNDALASLKSAVDHGFRFADLLASHEDFAPLHRDIRFQNLLARVVDQAG